MITRDALYDLVWLQPMTKVAQQFDVSGSYLARICTLLNVPRPERGYWAKLAVGKAPPKVPLPPARPGDPLHWSNEGERVPQPKPLAPKVPRERKSGRKIRVPREHTHHLIRGAKPHIEKTRRIDEGMYLKPYKFLLVDVTASQAGLDKALGLANDLFNALESVGHRVTMASAAAGLRRVLINEHEGPAKPRQYWEHSGLWSPYRPTVVYVGTVAIGLTIIEMSESVTLRYLNGKYVRESEYVQPRGRYNANSSWTTTRELPCGRMRIVAYCPYGNAEWVAEWQETKTASLSGQLAAIVETIEAAAPEIVAKLAEAERLAEIRHQEWLVTEDRRKRKEDRQCIARSIDESHSELRKIIGQWSDVIAVERFLVGIEQTTNDQSPADSPQIHQRLALARNLLGSTDPLDFFRNWKTPNERYMPKYPADQT
jgi:hypothetical protein